MKYEDELKDKLARWAKVEAHLPLGSPHLYRHALIPTLAHTVGVHHLAEIFGAYWLVDAIASYQTRDHARAATLQVWTLTLDGEGGATLIGKRIEPGTADKDKEYLIATQGIPYTDFPVELSPLTLWIENNMLLFPAER